MSTLSDKSSFQEYALVSGYVLSWEAWEEQHYAGRLLRLQEDYAGWENTAPRALKLTSADHFTRMWMQTTKSQIPKVICKQKRLTKAGNLPTRTSTGYYSVAQMSTYFLIKPKSTQAEFQVFSRPVVNYIQCHKIEKAKLWAIELCEWQRAEDMGSLVWCNETFQVLNEYDHPSQNSQEIANKTKSTLSPA